MLYIILLAIVIIISHIVLYKMMVKITKYQNFKSNVLMRLVLSGNFKSLDKTSKEFCEIDDPDWMEARAKDKNEILDRIKQKINMAIDEELDNDSNWGDTLSAINYELQSFHADNSYPFYQIFDREIIKRFNERNKETIKKKN